MNKKNFRLTFTAASILVIAIAIFLTSVVGNMGNARIDLTTDKLFTMSPSAAKILGELTVPVQVKYYVTGSSEMPTELKNLERDITDKLNDYESASGGMLQFSVYDPQNNEELQDELTGRGLRPFKVQSIDKDEMGIKLIWSSLSIAYKDFPEEVIPQVLPQSINTLEYELISLVYRLTQNKKPKVALYAPAKEVDQQTAMMYMQQGMQPPAPQEIYGMVGKMLEQEQYEVIKVDITADSQIPADADILVVLGPQNLTPRQEFEINRAISSGMNTLFAVQAHEYNYSFPGRSGISVQGRGVASGLENMFSQFGVSVSADHLCDSNNEILGVPRQQNLGGMRFQTNEPVRLPIHVKVSESQMNQDVAITNRISELLYLWGTAIETDKTQLLNNDLTFKTLMSSSNKSWSADFADGQTSNSIFNEVRGEGRMPLAIMVEGTFPDAYSGREVPQWNAETEVAEQFPAINPVPAKMVLVGCAKMFDDSAMQAGQNALLLLNSIDSMVHGDDLISIRSKLMTQRVINPIGDTAKVLLRFFVVGLIPIVLVIFGLSRANSRR
ncbi:GldG family protein, partial [bacterium]|nr:GldG family protein [bacterium]